MKRNDFLLAGVVLVAAALLFIAGNLLSGEAGGEVVILTDGVETGRYSLKEDREVLIEGAFGLNNRLVIRDGKADITGADCPDKLCVRQKSISKNHETLVCLPNRVVAEVVSGEEPEMDAVAN